MPYGAGFVAATAAGAAAIVDPRPFAAPALQDVFARYPHIGAVLPALGYGPSQLRALEETISRTDADVVVSGTPVDLGRLLSAGKPVVRARYEFAEAGEPGLGDLVDAWVATLPPTR
jgi:predicted GTPase